MAISTTPALVESFIGTPMIRAGYQNWKKRIKVLVHSPEDDLRRGEADIGLQMAFPPEAEFQAHTLGKVPLVAVLREDSPLACLPTLRCAQIAAHPLVCYDADWSPMGGSIRTAFATQGLRYDPACVVPFCANVCSMVRICGGVGIVDEMTARDHVMRGLVTRPVEDLPPVSIVAFYRRHEPMRAPVQDLLTALLR